jgi:hypothetical protein
MNVIINNSEEKFNGINSIVFYKQENNVSTAVKILHKYSNDKIVNSDFIEYGVTSLVEKSKFNSNDLIDYLDNDCKEIFGSDPDDLSKMVNNYILPTNSSSVTPPSVNYGYFGAKTIQKNVLLTFEAPEGIDCITLREDIGLKLEDCGSKDNYKIQLNLNREEVSSSKVIFITLTLETYDTPKLTVTYNIWRYDINANRNKPNYTLRNDEFYSTGNGTCIIGEKDDRLLVDKSSGTLVGYDNVPTNTPILDKKIAKWKNNKTYNPKTVYNIGDIVEYGRYKAKVNNLEVLKPFRYISLRNNNIGNNPQFSNKWILEDKFTDYLTTKINISVNPANSAETYPSGFFSLSKNATSCVFKIKYNPGYELDVTDSNYVSSGGDSLTDYASGYEGDGFYEVKLNNRDTKNEAESVGWRTKLLNTRSITFSLKSIDYELNIVESIDSSNPATKTVYYSNNNGENWTVLQRVDNKYKNPSGVSFNINTLIKVEYRVDSHSEITKPVIASGLTGNGIKESKELPIQTEERGGNTYYYFIDKLSFVGSTTYSVSITREIHNVRITGDLKYLEINKIFIEEKYGEPIVIKFYKDTNYKTDSTFLVNPKVYINGKMIQWIGRGQIPPYLNPDHCEFTMNVQEIEIDGRTELMYIVEGICKEDYNIQIKAKNDN